MEAKIGMECILCHRPMNATTKPKWIFDLEKQKLLGLAHTTCTYKANLEWDASSRSEWGQKSPSERQIIFGCKIAKVIKQLRKYGCDSPQFHALLLIHPHSWKAETAQEILTSQNTSEMTDWWVNGSKIKTEQQIQRIKEIIKTQLAEEA